MVRQVSHRTDEKSPEGLHYLPKTIQLLSGPASVGFQAGLPSLCALHHPATLPLANFTLCKPVSLPSWRGRMLAPATQNQSDGVEPISWRWARAWVGLAKWRQKLSRQVSEQEALICVFLAGSSRRFRKGWGGRREDSVESAFRGTQRLITDNHGPQTHLWVRGWLQPNYGSEQLMTAPGSEG